MSENELGVFRHRRESKKLDDLVLPNPFGQEGSIRQLDDI